MTLERQALLISRACKEAGLDSNIKLIHGRKQIRGTWAEKIAAQFMQNGQDLPVNDFVRPPKILCKRQKKTE